MGLERGVEKTHFPGRSGKAVTRERPARDEDEAVGPEAGSGQERPGARWLDTRGERALKSKSSSLRERGPEKARSTQWNTGFSKT
jgi:hypothetical protein